jgi:hypothetical protein
MARGDFDLADRNPLALFYAQMIEKINLKLPAGLVLRHPLEQVRAIARNSRVKLAISQLANSCAAKNKHPNVGYSNIESPIIARSQPDFFAKFTILKQLYSFFAQVAI